ncbi:hypothetical protein IQ07DRAFT_253497 [Pyrenochaeta sp. DS3sAY3a]|nr:hypothetical protein IQ07DRAFT_253497 [Pyrenochaeta sp. DS3sAY3a]
MANLKSFHVLLQKTVEPDDVIWDFTVPNLPKPQLTNAAGLMKCVSVIASTEKQGIKLRFESAPTNRVTSQEKYDRFILISFPDFRLQWPATSEGKATRPATGRENGDYITRMLTTGLKLNGTQYHFFGHSNSQLKSRSCFFFAGTKEEISIKIESMGDLSKLKSVGKKAKRIGLLFSSAEVSLTLSPDRCEDIDDVASKDYIFTDGCGLISLQLARQIAQRRNIIFRNTRYLPLLRAKSKSNSAPLCESSRTHQIMVLLWSIIPSHTPLAL